MSVESEINRIKGNVADSFAAVAEMGGTLPEEEHSNYLAAAVRSISGGSSGGGIPSGVIVIWSGTAANVPSGWALCDGTNGTPDLRDRFVLGAGSRHAAGTSGGAETVTLTVEQMPKHNHKVSTSGATHNNTLQTIMPVSGILDSSTEFYQANATVPTGGSQSHENMPPYYALCYIIKLSEETAGTAV